MAGKEDLLFGALNCGGEVQIICFLEFLSRLESLGVSVWMNRIRFNKGREKGGQQTMLVSWASATRFSASALTSSCSRVIVLVFCGSLYLSFWISSVILALWSLLG